MLKFLPLLAVLALAGCGQDNKPYDANGSGSGATVYFRNGPDLQIELDGVIGKCLPGVESASLIGDTVVVNVFADCP